MNHYIKKYSLIFFIIFSTFHTKAQNAFAGIEIGGKGVKVSIIKIIDIRVGDFEIVKTWSRNTNITTNMDNEGNLNKDDIDDTSYVVFDLLAQIKKEYKIVDKNIFIVASSSVAIAKNNFDLATKIKSLTNRNLDFITPEIESKLIIKGSIPQRDYLNSLILDIGSGSIKAGIIDQDLKTKTYAFSPFGTKFGTTKLTEKIKEKVEKSKVQTNFLDEMLKFQDSLSGTIKKMFDKVPTAKNKENVYVLGGAIWTFITFTKPNEIDAYQAFSQKELLDYSDKILNHYEEFVKTEYVNKDYERVLKAFDKEAIISGCILANQLIANLDKPSNKKYYFVRQGQVSWLIAYIVDSARENKY
jgi:exopolyphosphatase/pppGpp-phosphohydrolase